MLQMTDAIEAWFSLIWACKATFEKQIALFGEGG